MTPERIKPEELRSGNLVNRWQPGLVDTDLYTITGHDIAQMEFSEANRIFIGIPLSKDWLERFGWRFYNGKTDGDMTRDTLCKIDIDWINGRICIKSHYEPADHYRPLKHVKYVHNLQNIWYEFTGIELTIKREPCQPQQ